MENVASKIESAKEDLFNTYSTELMWSFKEHPSAREYHQIMVSENNFKILTHSEDLDECVSISLTPKSARVFAKMLNASAAFVESINFQSMGKYLPDEEAVMNRFEQYPHLKKAGVE